MRSLFPVGLSRGRENVTGSGGDSTIGGFHPPPAGSHTRATHAERLHACRSRSRSQRRVRPGHAARALPSPIGCGGGRLPRSGQDRGPRLPLPPRPRVSRPGVPDQCGNGAGAGNRTAPFPGRPPLSRRPRVRGGSRAARSRGGERRRGSRMRRLRGGELGVCGERTGRQGSSGPARGDRARDRHAHPRTQLHGNHEPPHRSLRHVHERARRGAARARKRRPHQPVRRVRDARRPAAPQPGTRPQSLVHDRERMRRGGRGRDRVRRAGRGHRGDRGVPRRMPRPREAGSVAGGSGGNAKAHRGPQGGPERPPAPPRPAPTPPPRRETMLGSTRSSGEAAPFGPAPSRSSSTSPAPAPRTRSRTGGGSGS